MRLRWTEPMKTCDHNWKSVGRDWHEYSVIHHFRCVVCGERLTVKVYRGNPRVSR